MQITSYLPHMWEKVCEIARYPLAWLSGIGLFLVDAVTGGRLIIYMVVIASVIDLFCGIGVAIKRKDFARSELMRLTVEKILVYGAVLLVFLCIDLLIERETGFTTDLTSGVVGSVMTLAEAVSFTASLLILFPSNAFLQMFQKMLKGELARKLNCEESEVDALLAKARRKKKQPRAKNGQFVKSPKK